MVLRHHETMEVMRANPLQDVPAHFFGRSHVGEGGLGKHRGAVPKAHACGHRTAPDSIRLHATVAHASVVGVGGFGHRSCVASLVRWSTDWSKLVALAPGPKSAAGCSRLSYLAHAEAKMVMKTNKAMKATTTDCLSVTF